MREITGYFNVADKILKILIFIVSGHHCIILLRHKRQSCYIILFVFVRFGPYGNLRSGLEEKIPAAVRIFLILENYHCELLLLQVKQ